MEHRMRAQNGNRKEKIKNTKNGNQRIWSSIICSAIVGLLIRSFIISRSAAKRVIFQFLSYIFACSPSPVLGNLLHIRSADIRASKLCWRSRHSVTVDEFWARLRPIDFWLCFSFIIYCAISAQVNFRTATMTGSATKESHSWMVSNQQRKHAINKPREIYTIICNLCFVPFNFAMRCQCHGNCISNRRANWESRARRAQYYLHTI